MQGLIYTLLHVALVKTTENEFIKQNKNSKQ